MTAGTQIFLIGIVLFLFALRDMTKMMNDPTQFAMNDFVRHRYQMFTASFFMIGSIFIT